MSKKYTTLSEESLALLCELIRESHSVSDGISDTTVATNSTFSSVRIQQLMDALSEEDRKYTEDLVGNLKRLVTEVVDTVPTVDTAKVNTLYLYKAADDTDNSYTQYMLINDAIVTLGTTEVNLDDYYNKANADDKFATKVDLEGVTNTIGDTTTLTTDSKIVVDAISEIDTIIDEILDGTTAVPKAEDALTLNGLAPEEIAISGARNLFSYPYFESTVTREGITFTDIGDGTVSVVGTSTNTSMFNMRARIETDKALILNAGTYTLSGCPSGGSGATYRFWVGTVDADNNATFIGHDIGDGYTFTLTETTKMAILFQIYSGQTFNGEIVKPMLEMGSLAHDYVPYNYGGAKNADMLDGYHASDILEKVDTNNALCKSTLGYTKKNLLPYPYVNSTITRTGIDWTDNGDGTITANGTNNSTDTHSLFNCVIRRETDIPLILEAGTYTLNGCPSDGSSTTYAIQVGKTLNDTFAAIGYDFGNGVTFTLTESTQIQVQLLVAKGATVTNIIFKPMIRYAEIEDDTWEAYKPSVKIAMENYDSDIALAKTTLGYECKNVFPYPYANTTMTNKGITYTDNGNGTIAVNGTATEDTAFVFGNKVTLSAGTYILSGAPLIDGKCALQISDTQNDLWIGDVGETVKFTVTEETTFDYNRILIGAGVTVDNLIFEPMIRAAEITDDTYEPYNANVDVRLSAIEESVSDKGKLLIPYVVLESGTSTHTDDVNNWSEYKGFVLGIECTGGDGTSYCETKYIPRNYATITDSFKHVMTLNYSDSYSFIGFARLYVSSNKVTFVTTAFSGWTNPKWFLYGIK